MAYEKFDPDKTDMKAIAVKYNGNVKAIAKEMKVCRDTIYKYFKRDPKGKEIIDHVRGYNTFTDADLAEHVIRYNMSNFEEKPAIAQRSAEFFLVHKAKDRGWVKDEESKSQDSTLINKAMDLINILQNQSSDLNIADNNISNADKSMLEMGEDIA
jgi:hypothetical protein